MAGERNLPGLGLFGFWAEGSNGWKDQNDNNLLRLSALTQARVISATTALPAGAQGQRYIVPAGAGADAGKIAVRDAGAWVYFDPLPGFMVFVEDTKRPVIYVDGAWRDLLTHLSQTKINQYTESLTLGLADAGAYVRVNAPAPVTVTVPPSTAVEFPIGTIIQIRQQGAGRVDLVAGAGVSLLSSETLSLRKRFSTAAIMQISANVWDVTGDMLLVEE